MYGYGILNNHVPTLRATAMRGGSINPLYTSLYAVYKGESNANDSLSTYNGTAQGGLTYTAGKSGNAFTFNGTNAYVSLPNDSLNTLTGDFSISMWVSFADLSNNSVLQSPISSISYNGTSIWGFLCYTTGNSLDFKIFNGTLTAVTLTDSNVGSTNTWYNYVIVRKGSTSTKIYKNGTLVAFNTSTTNPVYNSGNMRPSIGAATYGPLFSNLTQYYMTNGSKIDEVNIWTKELTPTEVTELYNAGTGKFYPY